MSADHDHELVVGEVVFSTGYCGIARDGGVGAWFLPDDVMPALIPGTVVGHTRYVVEARCACGYIEFVGWGRREVWQA